MFSLQRFVVLDVQVFSVDAWHNMFHVSLNNIPGLDIVDSVNVSIVGSESPLHRPLMNRSQGKR